MDEFFYYVVSGMAASIISLACATLDLGILI